jgi:hypothetical protein
VSGVSDDRLTVFTWSWETATSIFIRETLEGEFVRANQSLIPSVRTVPVGAECGTLLGVRTRGGCQGEELVTLVADSQPVALPDVSSLSLTADSIGPNDGELTPNGQVDAIFDVPVQGPLSSLILVGVLADRTPLRGEQWDTLVGDQVIPPGTGLGGTGGETRGLGVQEHGRWLNAADGSLTALGPGRHDLVLYAEDGGEFLPGRYFLVKGIRPDGSIANGTVFQYPAAPQ